MQLILSQSNFPPKCLHFKADTTINDIKKLLNVADGYVLRTSNVIPTINTKLIHLLQENSNVLFLTTSLPILGGKGGFGSMLRAQGGKMNSKKTTNFDACRDLSGRRLKTIKDAQELANFLEKEPERKRKREEKLKKKIEAVLNNQNEPKRVRINDEEFEKNHDESLENLDDVLEKALLKKKKIIEQTKLKGKSEKEEDNSDKRNKKILKIWGESDISDDE
ncbi:hypothetical protein HK099_006265 [Clydaea vesicula]|uniref:SDE2-like domain-containing protein n=1 Tax=Clydaea vesicula TaxID=447962 RepID=A0AAD5XYH0_9FUNG|nr:hypothetical protein HK099_006265 [Clydaea vesicula]KAJ3397088.1 hypothetical protein HDU92_000788 [Lobulomyces angularis]